MTKVRIVKLDDAIKMNKSPTNNKYSVYKNLIENPDKLKNYIEKKSRKNTETKFKEQFNHINPIKNGALC